MSEDPKVLLAMTDDELIEYALRGQAGSYVHVMGTSVLQLRALKKQMTANTDLVTHTADLAKKTNRLVLATWGVVVITLVTQVALLVMTWMKQP